MGRILILADLTDADCYRLSHCACRGNGTWHQNQQMQMEWMRCTLFNSTPRRSETIVCSGGAREHEESGISHRQCE
jgi:hypothetical protein